MLTVMKKVGLHRITLVERTYKTANSDKMVDALMSQYNSDYMRLRKGADNGIQMLYR